MGQQASEQMEQQNLRFAGGSAETLLHPAVLLAALLAIGLILRLPRRHVIVPLLLVVFLIPKGQVLVIAGAHFTIAKILNQFAAIESEVIVRGGS